LPIPGGDVRQVDESRKLLSRKFFTANLENFYQPFARFGLVFGTLSVRYVHPVFGQSLHNAAVCRTLANQLENKLNALLNFGIGNALPWHQPLHKVL